MSDLDSKLAALRDATENLSPDEAASERLKQALAAESGSGPDVSALLGRRWWPWLWLGVLVVVAVILVRWVMPAPSPEQQPSGSSPSCACRLPTPPDQATLVAGFQTPEERSEAEALVRKEHHADVLAWADGLSRLLAACPTAERERMLADLGQRGCQIAQRQRAEWARNGHSDAAAVEAATMNLDRFRPEYRLLLEASAPGLRFECDIMRAPQSENYQFESCPAFAQWDHGLLREYPYSVEEKRLAESHEANVALLTTYRDEAFRTRVVREQLRWLCSMAAIEKQPSRVDAFAAEARFFGAELQRLDPTVDSSCGAVLDGGAF